MKELKKAQMGIIAVLTVMLVSMKRRLPTRRFSSGITTTLTLAGIVLLVAAGTVSAEFACVADDGSGDAYFCGDTVMKSCTLNGSMTCTDNTKPGLIVGASGITIDGAGFSMTGAISGSVCANGIMAGDTGEQNPAGHSGIISQFDNVVIKNIEIKNFCGGIGIGDSGHNSVENNTVIGCNIHDCGDSVYETQGIHMVYTSNCSITKNDVHSIDGDGIPGGCTGGGNGIFMYGKESTARGWYNNFTCNNLHNNVKSGFFMKHQCMHNTISYNNASDNAQAGIMPKCDKSNHNTFEYNTMIGNTVYGFFTNGDDNTIRYNTIKSATGEGLVLGPNSGAVGANSVTHNCVCNDNNQDIVDMPSRSTGDNNTCVGDPGGWCDWNCGNNVPVYFDYDKDGQCSKKWDDCLCTLPGTGSKCACCNPGLFDGSSAATTAYENSCNRDCQWTPGPDPNDCDFDITGIIKPDLVVEDKSETWVDETNYTVSYRVHNIGNGTSNESVACVYIDTVYQAGSDHTIVALAPNAYSTVKTVGPFTMSDLNDTIKVCADCGDSNDEWDETNNCTENVWDANQPDLDIIEKHEEWVDQATGTYNITYTVKNIGTATAGASKTKVWIDGNVSSPPGPGNIPELAPDAEYTDTIGPHAITGDSDTIKLCADGPDVVSESDETNNCIENTWSKNDLTIYVDPASLNITPQHQFDINIKVDPAGLEIYGVEYYLTYDTSIVRAESQVKGPFLGTSSDTIVVVNDIDRTNGKVSYAETRREPDGAAAEGISSVIQFTAIGPADNCTGLNLSGVIIVKADKTTVTAIIENGTVCITNNQPPVASGCSKHRINNVQKKFECLAQLCSDSHDDDGDNPDGGGDIVYIRWAFGDGEYGTSEGLGECPCKYHSYISWIWEPFGVSYDDGGRYVPFNVSLTVTDNGDPQLDDETKFNVTVYMAGDTNGDGVVNIIDAVYIGLSWDDKCEDSTTCCQNRWASEQSDAADLNNDCEVNILDAVIVGTMWGHEAWYPV